MAYSAEKWGTTKCEFCREEGYQDEKDICVVCCGVGEVGYEVLPFGVVMLYVIN